MIILKCMSTFILTGMYSLSWRSIDSGFTLSSTASRNNTPSPPNFDKCNETVVERKLDSVSSNKDEGIEMDESIEFMLEDRSGDRKKVNMNTSILIHTICIQINEQMTTTFVIIHGSLFVRLLYKQLTYADR